MRPEIKSRSRHRTRTVRSIASQPQTIISKHVINFQDDGKERTGRTHDVADRRQCRQTDLDCIVRKLGKACPPEDLLIMITPSSRHPKHYKLHVLDRKAKDHRGMTSVSLKELQKLRCSETFRNYCMIFSSHYMDLRTMALKTETITNLVRALDRKCCGHAMRTLNGDLRSQTSLAGDYVQENKSVVILKSRNSIVQTDAEVFDNMDALNLPELLATYIETINSSVVPHKTDQDRYFMLANELQCSLTVRPELLWKSTEGLNDSEKDNTRFHVETYLPGGCYIGHITLYARELLLQLDVWPNLLDRLYVIRDVFEITPLPRWLVGFLRKLLGFLKIELLYDTMAEFFFERYTNFAKVLK